MTSGALAPDSQVSFVSQLRCWGKNVLRQWTATSHASIASNDLIVSPSPHLVAAMLSVSMRHLLHLRAAQLHGYHAHSRKTHSAIICMYNVSPFVK